MDLLRKLPAPLRRAARLLFVNQLRLRWQGGPRLEFAARDEPAAQDAEPAALKAQRELAAMQQELAVVLDDMPELREELRHLVYVEQALLHEGLEALYTMPLDVLQRALDQFEGLVTNWSSPGLANLRSKMAVAVGQREADPEGLASRRSAVRPVSGLRGG